MSVGSYYPKVVQLQQEGRYPEALQLLEEGVKNKDPMSAWYLYEQMDHGIWTKRDPERLKQLRREFEKEWKPFRLLHERVSNISDENEQEEIEALLDEIETEAFRKNDPVLFYLYYELSQYTIHEALEKKGDCYLLKSAEMNYAIAQDMLSNLDDDNKGHWDRKAAEQGHPMSMWGLGLELFKEKKFAAAGYWIWKLITETQEGKTTGRAAGFWNEHIDVFKKLRRCKESMMTFIAIRRFRQSALSIFPRDIVILIAKILWQTNQEDCWNSETNRMEKMQKLEEEDSEEEEESSE
jgi:TPR repeat protein